MAKKITQESLKQFRLVVGDPVHMSHRPRQEVLDKWNLQHPVAELQNRILQENHEAESASEVQETHDGNESKIRQPLAQIPSHTTGVARPAGGIIYLDRTSMLIRMSKAHKQGPKRPARQDIVFDQSIGAKNGLRRCKHYDKELCDWSSLRKHIQEK